MHPLTDTAVVARLDRAPWLRFLAALGVGAEYAIINVAIAEFMPARVRGKANAAVINFWPAGAIVTGLLAFFALVGLYFRRRLPESPRWPVAAFWLVGAGAMATYTWSGGAEGAGRSLENLALSRTAPAQLEAA